MQVQVSLKIEIEATANLTQMEQQIQEAGRQAMREALKQTVRQWEEQSVSCPHCGGTQRRLEGTTRRNLSTTFGRVQIQRRRFRCLQCWQRSVPANRLLADLGGATVSQPLQEAAILAGASWSYRVASHQLHKLCGADISAEEIRLLTNRYGKQRAHKQQEEAQQPMETQQPMEAEATPVSCPSQKQQPLLMGWDGGWVCSREQRGGMEGKVGVVASKVQALPMPKHSSTFSWSERGGPRRPRRQRYRLSKRRYVATFGPSKDFGVLAAHAANRLKEHPKQPEALIADGAEWIKTQQKQHFPDATCILDWAHLWREVGRTLRAVFRAKQMAERERQYQSYLYRYWLWHGGVDQAVQGLQDLREGLPEDLRERVNRTITYLQHQREWIGSYEQWRRLGYPVGSGMIERAVSLVINRRMKKRGMRWCRDNATAVVALRTDLLNEDWEIPQRLRAFP